MHAPSRSLSSAYDRSAVLVPPQRLGFSVVGSGVHAGLTLRAGVTLRAGLTVRAGLKHRTQ